MKFLIQRVERASLTIDHKEYSAINQGFVVLVGICDKDTNEIMEKMVKKLLNLRIFEDQDQKTNLSLADVHGELMLVSQFTLYADCTHGNRPSFLNSGSYEHASKLYLDTVALCKKSGYLVKTGIFGADMKIELLNDGPFTILLDSDELFHE